MHALDEITEAIPGPGRPETVDDVKERIDRKE